MLITVRCSAACCCLTERPLCLKPIQIQIQSVGYAPGLRSDVYGLQFDDGRRKNGKYCFRAPQMFLMEISENGCKFNLFRK